MSCSLELKDLLLLSEGVGVVRVENRYLKKMREAFGLDEFNKL